MREPRSYSGLEELGRIRLSKYFFMRDFLYSEISNFHAVPNVPDNPSLAIAAGTKLCTELLDPLTETFGPLHIRSSYRSSALNHFGATEAKPQRCSANPANFAGHIWDRLDEEGHMGATACVVVPWFADQFEKGRDWRDLAWWIHDHLPYAAMWFFPKRAAFNLNWHEAPSKSIDAYMPRRVQLLKSGAEPSVDVHARKQRYADFPPLRGIAFPAVSKEYI